MGCNRRGKIQLTGIHGGEIMIRGRLQVLVVLAYSLLVLTASADWPPIVSSKRDVERLPASTASVRARGLPDADIPSLGRLLFLKHLDFGGGQKVMAAAITDKGLAKRGSLNVQQL